ncbi:Trypsin-4-like Protein [Tribolium castaneum]|uniref:Trypsin-4-like Protein n=1 Tax=Tribolium castaneum TaxID=7070 RepID=A0A139WF29_TRICA|nr:PREDICTED: trypsin-4 isoform X2 [Tribolium castaneum]KYB26475.1 Trypsin-4-like Protein [Tribolium castaneum]|eukprot:XP_015837693.1 PREDICTED: trypsin-4 isoform X2 [Tribolium castaneum]
MLLITLFLSLLSSCLSEIVKLSEYPYIATLSYGSDRSVCGGAFVSERVFLTAASCMSGLKLTQVISEMYVESFPNKYKVQDLVKHPDFEEDSCDSPDLALLYLKKSTIFSIILSIVSLKPNLPIYIGAVSQNAVVSAFYVDSGARHAYKKDLLTVTSEEGFCDSTDGTFCAKNVHPSNPCVNTFGGPVVNSDKELVGIIPYDAECTSCHAEQFIRISYYKEWMKKTIKKFT